MSRLQGSRWRERMAEINNQVDAIEFPDQESGLDQDEEWCAVTVGGQTRRVRFHDYHHVYKVPGFYEKLFYEKLKCCSPSRVVGLLCEVMRDHKADPKALRVLDIGAGNGMVGDELDNRGVGTLVGIDIIPEARTATDRDRPGLYNDYLITDLTDLPEQHEEQLRKLNLNCLTTVAALGYGDIPDAAFLKGLDVVETPAWLAFNIKEDFIHHQDTSGFSKLIRKLNEDGVIRIEAWRRYRHRLSIKGKPLYYVAMVARKMRDVPDELMERH